MTATPSLLTVRHPDQLALERELHTGSGQVGVPWDQRPVLNMQTAAALLGCSVAKVYSLAADGQSELINLAGRTQVRTPDVVRLIREAMPWQPSGKTRAVITQRARNTLAKDPRRNKCQGPS
jgi:hypothetical protein